MSTRKYEPPELHPLAERRPPVPLAEVRVPSDDQSAIDSLIAEAVAAEKERCARIAEDMDVWQIAAAIRGRPGT